MSKISRNSLVKLFEELGFNGANAWSEVRMQKRLEAIGAAAAENPPTSKAACALVDVILKAQAAGTPLEITGEGTEVAEPAKKEEETPAAKPTAKKAAKKAVKGAAAKDETPASKPAASKPAAKKTAKASAAKEEKSEDSDTVPVRPAKKAAPKKAAKGAKKAPPKREESGPGVIESIIEFCSAGSKEKPVTKAEILKKLVKRFPNREEAQMKVTINCQLPKRLIEQKGLDVRKDGEGGFWIAGKKKAAK